MDEVDNIIIQSLRQIGCKLENDDDDNFSLNNLTPDLLVKVISKCLHEIKPSAAVPKSLPENMAQRFTVATTLADECSSCGYRGDIGYQTFLYPNVVDVRRLLMFLIEQFPKEQKECSDKTADSSKERDNFELLMKDIKKKIAAELKSPWVPQYSQGISNRKFVGTSSLAVEFIPQLNLHINEAENPAHSKECLYKAPNIFQQCAYDDYDLVSSVLHKCSIDVFSSPPSIDGLRLLTGCKSQSNIRHNTELIKSKILEANQNESSKEPSISIALQSLIAETDSLKEESTECMKRRQEYTKDLNEIRQKRTHLTSTMEQLKCQKKLHERTCVILENPLENIEKLEGLIEKIRERRLALESQWQQHRDPALKQIEDLQKIRKAKNIQNIEELRKLILILESNLREKTNLHCQLSDDLKKRSLGLATRNEYTRRIYEFIGNIRKQRNDIYKILDDTKDLQKQLNSVSAQLLRQFNYTDDLLFQSAKHDLHAKQAYKLLASLHSSCNEIYDLVSHTGQMTKETRDLEVQIDRERMRDVSASLEKITADISQFEMTIKSMQLEINSVENEIHFA